MKRTTAPNSVGGAYVDKVPGVTIGTTLIAEDRNLVQEEICNVVEGAGLTLSGADDEQLYKAIVGLSHAIGEPVFNLLELSPAVGFPAVRVDDSNHDISTANWPDLVPALRAQKAKSDGVTDHSGTVAGSVFTFPTNQAADRLLAALAEEVLVHGSYTSWLALNIGGTDYAITNVNPGARTVTVSGSPATGAQTGIVYPYRIAGSTTTARVRRMSGRALVGTEAESGDTPDRMLLAGLRARDRGQGHWHDFQVDVTTGTGGAAGTRGAPTQAGGGTYVRSPSTDTVNGTPRTGATTEPRSYAAHAYLWGRRYIP